MQQKNEFDVKKYSLTLTYEFKTCILKQNLVD